MVVTSLVTYSGIDRMVKRAKRSRVAIDHLLKWVDG